MVKKNASPHDENRLAAENSLSQVAPGLSKGSHVGAPVPQPQEIPMVAHLINYGDRLTRLRTMLDACLKVVEPADGTLSALAVTHLTEAAKKNDLGTLTPSEALVGIDEHKRYLYILPAPPKTLGATRLRYKNGQVLINLYEAFAKNDRLVFPDVREYYDVTPTPGEITIPNIYKGWGVYVDLHDVVKEPIKRLSEEEAAARAAKAAQTRAAKAAKKHLVQPPPTPDAEPNHE